MSPPPMPAAKAGSLMAGKLLSPVRTAPLRVSRTFPNFFLGRLTLQENPPLQNIVIAPVFSAAEQTAQTDTAEVAFDAFFL